MNFDTGVNAIYRRAYHEAITYLEKAIAIDGKRAEFYISLAQANIFTGNIFRAIQLIKKCLSIDTDNEQALQFMDEIKMKGII